MIGNVWEGTGDWCSQKHEPYALKACCIQQILVAGPKARATTLVSPTSGYLARCLAARIFALPTAAEAFVRPRGMPSRPLPQQAMSASGASLGRGS
jgi:hypothetical protein